MPSLSQLIETLKSGDAEQRLGAAEQLVSLGTEATSAASALVQACGDESPEVREAAIGALEAIESPPAAAVPELMTLLDSSHSDIGYWAATLLGRIGCDSKAAVSALAKVLERSPHLAVRERTAWALGAIGPDASSSIPVLRSLEVDDNPRLSRLCTESIEKISGEPL